MGRLERLGFFDKPAEPTIVGVYVMPDYRGKGLGRQVFETAVKRCVERALLPIKIDLMSAGIKRTVDSLPKELWQHLLVNNMGDALDSLPG